MQMRKWFQLLSLAVLLLLAGCRATGNPAFLDRYVLDLTFRPDGVRIEVVTQDEPVVESGADGATPAGEDGSANVAVVPMSQPTPGVTSEPASSTAASVPAGDTAPAEPADVAEVAKVAEETIASVVSSEVARDWFLLALDLVRDVPGYSPPVAARAYGYLGIVLYETVQPGMEDSVSLAGQLNGLTELPMPDTGEPVEWALAANRSLAQTLRYLFPTAPADSLQAIDRLEEHYFGLLHRGLDDATLARSIDWGDSIAHAVYRWSQEDGGHEGQARNFPTDFPLTEGIGVWQTTPPDYAGALQPYWGENRPFVLTSGATCPAPPPPAYSEAPNSEFYAHALEVYEVGRHRTAEQAAIAEFWADDPVRTATPGGHWISILTSVLAEQDASLALAGEAYARLGIALNDAFITCWHTKYEYNVMRPITYIQNVIDPNWNVMHSHDPVGTPPFPEYTSGHSVQSGAAADVLTALFGADYAFVDTTHVALGLPAREYVSFSAAAEEAAISRLYGGIHFRPAIEAGLAQGQCVAERVNQLRFTTP